MWIHCAWCGEPILHLSECGICQSNLDEMYAEYEKVKELILCWMCHEFWIAYERLI